MIRGVLESAWRFARTAWKALLFCGTVVGILLLPADISELPGKYGLSWAWPHWLTRENILFALLALGAMWLLWADVRPGVMAWWRRRKAPAAFTIADHIYCEAYPFPVEEGGEEKLYLNVFYLAVSNRLKNWQNLNRVQARIFHYGPPTLCRIKDAAEGQTDIRHGEWAYFEIGRLASKNMLGLTVFGDVEQRFLKTYRHNVPRGYLSFEVHSTNSGREYSLGHRAEYPIVWQLLLVLSGDDVQSAQVMLQIDMSNDKKPVSVGKPPR
jgi:hypothetical protein